MPAPRSASLTAMLPVARASLLGAALATLGGVAAVTALLHAAPPLQSIASVSMLYLLLVLALALAVGRRAAVLAAVLAFLATDWFFVQPRFRFTVSDPSEWLALVTFLITALVVSQLTVLLRQRAEEAQQREREARLLAEASWSVASQVDRDRALVEVLVRLRDVSGASAAVILATERDGSLSRLAAVGDAGDQARLETDSARQLAAYVMEERHAVGWGPAPQHLRQVLGPGDANLAFLPLSAEQHVWGVACLAVPATGPLSEAARRVVDALALGAGVVLARDHRARLAADAQALREADRLKTALLSMVSHDFRSPLASLKAAVTSLLQDGAPVDPAVARELLRGADGQIDRLDKMVGNVLTLSRLEAGAWRPQVELTPVEELVGAALAGFSSAEDARVDVVLDPAVAEVAVDPVQMVGVLHNLLENGLKYSAAAARVELAVGRESDGVVLTVSDRGPGLPSGEEERVFEPFYRAPHLRESSQPGVGLGLAVCRGLVEAHGGRISARPRSGGGTVMRVELAPMEPPPKEPMQP